MTTRAPHGSRKGSPLRDSNDRMLFSNRYSVRESNHYHQRHDPTATVQEISLAQTSHPTTRAVPKHCHLLTISVSDSIFEKALNHRCLWTCPATPTQPPKNIFKYPKPRTHRPAPKLPSLPPPPPPRHPFPPQQLPNTIKISLKSPIPPLRLAFIKHLPSHNIVRRINTHKRDTLLRPAYSRNMQLKETPLLEVVRYQRYLCGKSSC